MSYRFNTVYFRGIFTLIVIGDISDILSIYKCKYENCVLNLIFILLHSPLNVYGMLATLEQGTSLTCIVTERAYTFGETIRPHTSRTLININRAQAEPFFRFTLNNSGDVALSCRKRQSALHIDGYEAIRVVRPFHSRCATHL